LLHPNAHEVVGTLRHADQTHAVVDPARAQSCLADGEPTVPLAQEVVTRHSHRVIHDLGVATVRTVAITQDMGGPFDVNARRVHRDDHRVTPVLLTLRR